MSNLIVISILFISFTAAAKDFNLCDAELSDAVSAYIYHYRQNQLQPAAVDIGTPEYQIKGKLGQSTSDVYLAIDPQTKYLVVIKKSARALPLALASLWREIVVTEYLNENGEIVPKILKVLARENGSTILVKEYFNGLTGKELTNEMRFYNGGLPKELSDDAWSTLDQEQSRLRALFMNGNQNHPSFKDWYLNHATKITSQYSEIWKAIEKFSQNDSNIQPKIESFLYTQDFGVGNLLYDTQLKKWLAFDP